ncbi:pre-rRNA-processing protein, partial [Corchorus capsularis]
MKDPIPLNARKERDAMDSDDIQEVQVIRSLVPDPLNQEPLLMLRIFEVHLQENRHGRQRQKWLRQIIIKSKRCLERELFLEALLSIWSELSSQFLAAWIIEDTDEEDSDAEDDDGMVLDEGEKGFPSQEGTKNPDFEDQASLYLKDSDEETENDSIMIEGENLTREQIEDEIKEIKEAHAEDE